MTTTNTNGVELIDGTSYCFGDPASRPADPEPFGVAIADVARQLSQINRFNGATRWPYSVAQHSVFVSDLLDIDALWALHGLMHDVHETVIGDIARPVKRALGTNNNAALDALSDDADRRIFAAFGIGWPVYPQIADAVRHADDVALVTERRDLMIGTDPWPALPLPHPRKVCRMTPARAAAAFVARFTALKERLACTSDSRSRVQSTILVLRTTLYELLH